MIHGPESWRNGSHPWLVLRAVCSSTPREETPHERSARRPDLRRAGRTPRARWAPTLTVLAVVAIVGHEARAEDQQPLPAPIRALPRGTSVVLFVPRARDGVSDLGRALEWLHLLEPDAIPPTAGDALARALQLDPLPAVSGAPSTWTELFTARGLDSIGIDLDGPVLALPKLDLTTREAAPGRDTAVVALPLRDVPAFERWLTALAGPAAQPVAIGSERAIIVGATREHPIACVIRPAAALCQVGAGADPDPLAPLRCAIARQVAGLGGSARAGRRAVDEPSLDLVTGLARAFSHLPRGARGYLLINPEPAAAAVAQLTAAHGAREHRFAAGRERAQAMERAQLRAQRIRRDAELFDGVAFAWYLDPAALTIRGQIAVSERGRRLLTELDVHGPGDDRLARWAATPALARLFLQMRPELAARTFAELGWNVPAEALTGAVALLLFGVDTECPLARKGEATAPVDWAFVLPSALAIGVRPRQTALLGRAVVDAVGGTTGVSISTSNDPGDGREPDVPSLRGHAFGSTLQIDLLDELVLIGTGPGSGAAALRRWRSLRADAAPPPAPASAPFLDLTIHLRAVDAALAAGEYGSDRRTELVLLDLVRRRMKPLLEQVGTMALDAHALVDDRRVEVNLALRR